MITEFAPKSRIVLRSTGSIWILAAAGLVTAYATVDALVRGDIRIAALALPWLLLACWLIFNVLVRPCLIATRDQLVVLNVLRRYEIPWALVDHLQSKYQLKVYLNDGRTVTSWGAPTAGVDRASRDASVRDNLSQSRIGSRLDNQANRNSGMSQANRRPPRVAAPPIDLVISRWRSQLEEESAVVSRTDAAPFRSLVEWRFPIVTVVLVLIGSVLSLTLR